MSNNRVVLLSNHSLLTAGIQRLLEAQDGLDLTTLDANSQTAIDEIRQLGPKVIILDSGDASLGDGFITHILREHPETRVIALNLARKMGIEVLHRLKRVVRTDLKGLLEALKWKAPTDREKRERQSEDSIPPNAGGGLMSDRATPARWELGTGRRYLRRESISLLGIIGALVAVVVAAASCSSGISQADLDAANARLTAQEQEAAQLRSQLAAIGSSIVVQAGQQQPTPAPVGYDDYSSADIIVGSNGSGYPISAFSKLSPIPMPQAKQGSLFMVDVELTDQGFQPFPLSLPRGVRIMLTVRNHTSQQRHFHVIGLMPDDLLWFERADQAGGAQSGTGMDGTSDEHQAHHDGNSFVPYHICTTALCDLAEGVHLHADPGDADTVIFTANQSGAFEVRDPLHPEFVGSVIVY